jgi:hypothetical protein
MATARELVGEIRRSLAEVEARLFAHPWVAAVEAGRMSRSGLFVFAVQQERIIASDLRSVAFLIHRYAGTPSGVFFLNSLKTEAQALECLGAFRRALERDPGSTRSIEVLPEAQTYTHFVAWLAMYGSDAEFAAAFLVNLPAWGKNCGRLANALRSRYALSAEEASFFTLFVGDAPGFEEAALAVIQAGLGRGVSPGAIREAAQLLQRYELMYWDALQASTR